MNIIDTLASEFKGLISTEYELPLPYKGTSPIKAIILGADPTHLIDGKPAPLKMVFNLDNPKSPYWRGIDINLREISGLSMTNIYVQNVCRNYFNLETSKNKYWNTIAKDYWIPYLRNELDSEFSNNIPILMTTEFILNAALLDQSKKISVNLIYSNQLHIKETDNLFNRKMFAFYRHPRYSLKKWTEYSAFISRQIINNTKA